MVGFIFFAFFQIIFKKSVDCIVLKCYNIIVREIPLTIKKGEKYETKKGKEKTTQKEENESKLQNKLSNLHNRVGNRVGRIASLLYQIVSYSNRK